MVYRRTTVWLALLLILALGVAGCAPRVGAGETATTAAPDALVIDLPSIAVDVAEDGSLSLGGISLAELAGSFGVPADALALPMDTVKQMIDVGIQHVQIANRPDGLALVLNGMEIPSLRWTAEQLSTAGAMFGDQPMLGDLLPVLTQLGIGATLRLPVPEGAEAIPLQVESDATAAAELAAAEENFVEQVGTPPTINLPISYAEDGSWTVGGISGEIWSRLTGVELPELNIPNIMAAGIQSFDLRTDAQGLHLAVNSTEMPGLDWSEGKLANVVELATASGLLTVPNLDSQMLQTLLDTFLPILTSSNVNINISFPAP